MIEYGLNSGKKTTRKQSSSLVTMFSAEVIDIILSNTHADFQKLGGNSSIGLIKYRLIDSNKTTNNKSLSFAIPLQPNSKNYPLIGEIVLIYSGLPSKNTEVKDNGSINYYISGINIFNNSHVNNISDVKSFPKNNNHSPILPNIGDVVTEGRFQNSLRFSSDSNGNPLTIIRNGRKVENTEGAFTQEDINNDDSLIIFSSNQKVDLNVAYNDLKSFSISLNKPDETKISKVDLTKNIEKVDLNQIVKQDLPQNDDTVVDTGLDTIDDTVDYPLPENEGVDETQLDEVIEDEHISYIAQTQIQEFRNGKNLPKLEPPVNFNDAYKYIGGVESDIPNHIKAMIDVIAFCEGTLGSGKFNGYDTIVFNGRRIENWTKDYKLGCPHEPVYGRDGKLKQKFGHWGRYQYARDTWVLNAGSNIAFSKRNQDLVCAKTIKRRLGQIVYDNLYQNMQIIDGVYKVCLVLAKEWASIPYGNSSKSYYSNNNVRIQGNNIQKLYNLAYNIYLKK
jgi:hypothetical protein